MTTKNTADVFKALADDNRVDIVRYVSRHPRTTATELLERLDIAQSTLSHHMKVLVEAKVVTSERVGKWIHYSVNPLMVDRLDRFVTALRQEKQPRGRRPRAAAMEAPTEVDRD
jgi:ArsR family transcriptional regulator